MADERLRQEQIDWIRKKPPVVQKVMTDFPPTCRVRGRRPLWCPAQGEIGMVNGYSQKDDGSVTIYVVVDHRQGECRPEWLEVVDFTDHVTPEFVRLASGIDEKT